MPSVVTTFHGPCGDRRRRRGPWGWLLAAAALPAFAAGPLDVRYRDGALSVRIERVPLDEVMAAVARETGITIEGEPLDRRDVSKRFETLPLDMALRRLVGRQNFVLRYDGNGAPASLELLGAPLAPTKPTPRRGMGVVRAMLALPPVLVPPRVAAALGATRLPLQRVLAGLRHDDAVVRTEAAQVIVHSLENDASLLAAVSDMDGERLARFVSGQAGRYAADVAAKLYRAAHDPRLRARFNLMIAALQRTIS